MKIAIIGTAPASVGLAPYGEADWEIWGCSPGNRGQLPRVTVWFELHAIREMMAPENRGMAEPYFAWLKEQSEANRFQVVMQEINTYVPKAIPFPLHEMLLNYGHNWFASSIAFMMALAITRMKAAPGEKHVIGLWGVDMAADQEHYSGQRASCIRFMEIAREAGIEVQIPMESCLAEPPPLYGYSEATPMARRLNAVMQLAMAQRSQLAAAAERSRMEMAFFDGALEQLRYMQRTWVDGSEAVLDMGSLAEAAKGYADRIAASHALDRNAVLPTIPGQPQGTPALGLPATPSAVFTQPKTFAAPRTFATGVPVEPLPLTGVAVAAELHLPPSKLNGSGELHGSAQ